MTNYNKNTALKLCALGLLGVAGLHYFYIGRPFKGIVYLFTGGFLLVGTVIDLIQISSGNFKHTYTWQHVNADGSPDKRYSNNKKVFK